MAYEHGIYAQEISTQIAAPLTVDSGIIVAVGTAPMHLAKNPADLHKPALCYRFNEFVEQFGYSDDFDNYTLCEVAKVAFQLYGVAPVAFINVLDVTKHFNEVEYEAGGITNTAAVIEDAIDISTLKVTSGEKIDPTEFETDIDFEVRTDEVEDLDEGTTTEVITLHILNGDKVTDNKIKISYRTMATALGGTPVETEVTLTGLIYELPSDTVIHSVTVESGGVDTLQTLIEGTDFDSEYIGGILTVNLIDDTKVTDDTIKISYHQIDASKVTAAEIIGASGDNGLSTGIELIEGVYPRYTIVPGILIAPKFADDASVAAALVAKANSVGGLFPAVAVADIPTENVKTYTAAVEFKNQSNLTGSHLVLCYPQVTLNGEKYHLSTHAAALMNRVDVEEGGNVPYISPSNKTLQIDSAVLADGTEVYYGRDQANLLNANGICTALSLNGFKFWGNRTAAYPGTVDPKDNFIPIRRMFNWITSTFTVTYLSELDFPINRRQVESVVLSAQIFLNSLAARGCILGGTITFSDDLNSTADLMDGKLSFALAITPPSPARAITFVLEYDTNNLQELFS